MLHTIGTCNKVCQSGIFFVLVCFGGRVCLVLFVCFYLVWFLGFFYRFAESGQELVRKITWWRIHTLVCVSSIVLSGEGSCGAQPVSTQLRLFAHTQAPLLPWKPPDNMSVSSAMWEVVVKSSFLKIYLRNH